MPDSRRSDAWLYPRTEITDRAETSRHEAGGSSERSETSCKLVRLAGAPPSKGLLPPMIAVPDCTVRAAATEAWSNSSLCKLSSRFLHQGMQLAVMLLLSRSRKRKAGKKKKKKKNEPSQASIPRHSFTATSYTPSRSLETTTPFDSPVTHPSTHISTQNAIHGPRIPRLNISLRAPPTRREARPDRPIAMRTTDHSDSYSKCYPKAQGYLTSTSASTSASELRP
jgi:hypothetical protein